MLKRFLPTQPNGSATVFTLPDDYTGGDITIFINGQLLNTENVLGNPFDYDLDKDAKTFTFTLAPNLDDYLYVIYDSDGGVSSIIENNTGIMRLSKGYNLISYQGNKQAMWDILQHKVVYHSEILANVKNLIIDQVEDIYGVPAEEIIREIQTYSDDTQTYFTYKPGATGSSWVGNAEHVINVDLYRASDTFEYGDPDDSDFVAYTPDNFILSNCRLDASLDVISLDIDNPIQNLPNGLRTGIHVFIHESADLSISDNKLELRF